MSGTFFGLDLNEKVDIQSIKMVGPVDAADGMQLLNDESVSDTSYLWGSEETTPMWIEDPVGSDNWVPVPGWRSW